MSGSGWSRGATRVGSVCVLSLVRLSVSATRQKSRSAGLYPFAGLGPLAGFLAASTSDMVPWTPSRSGPSYGASGVACGCARPTKMITARQPCAMAIDPTTAPVHDGRMRQAKAAVSGISTSAYLSSPVCQ